MSHIVCRVFPPAKRDEALAYINALCAMQDMQFTVACEKSGDISVSTPVPHAVKVATNGS